MADEWAYRIRTDDVVLFGLVKDEVEAANAVTDITDTWDQAAWDACQEITFYRVPEPVMEVIDVDH